MISERQIRIIIILHDAERYITYKEIAEQLMVSVSTVRNDISVIRKYISKQKTGSLMTKPHSGIRLLTSELEWEQLYNELYIKPIEVREDSDILYAIIYLLLKRKESTITDLQKKLFVSRTIIGKTIHQAREWFTQNNILLEQKKGKGLKIHYTEFNWRLGMWGFYKKFNSLIKQQQTNSLINIQINSKEYHAMIEVLDGFDINGLLETIQYIEEDNGFRFSYDATIRIVFLLSLGITRARKKINIEVPNPTRCKTDGTYDELFVHPLICSLEKNYNIRFSDCEKKYIQFVVVISEIQEFTNDQAKQICQVCCSELCRFTAKIIRLISEIYNMNLNDDLFLAEHLFLELKSMIERLKYGVKFKNPLLNQIKEKYPDLIAATWAVSTVFDKELGLDINENEVGLLALYFGGAIERCQSLIRACVVCNYGIGISQIVKEKIEKEINDIKIIDVLSNRDSRKIRNLKCDFVISTIPIEEISCQKDVIVVNNLLLTADISNIENKMKQIREEKLRKKGSEGGLHLKLFSEDVLFTDLQIENKAELLKYCCKKLKNFGYVTQDFGASVINREEKVSTEVGKMIALPHGSSSFVIHPIVSVAVLKKPIKWSSSTEVDLVFLLAFNLDESTAIKNHIVRFYKKFVCFLENDEIIEQFKKNKNKKELVQYLNTM